MRRRKYKIYPILENERGMRKEKYKYAHFRKVERRMRKEQAMEKQNQQNQQGKQNQQSQLELALKTLHDFIVEKAVRAGKGEAYGEKLWEGIRQSGGLLQELAYYHDYGEFLCKYAVAGYTLADVLVWQVDHFKFYMDRPEEMNRYRQERLLLESFETMVQMEKDPALFAEKMRSESGQDAANG